MSHGNQVSDGLIGGLAFGAALGAAENISRKAATIDRLGTSVKDLAARYNELAGWYNDLKAERDKLSADYDEVKCSLIARKGQIEFLMKLLAKAYNVELNSADMAPITTEAERLRVERYRQEMRALGYWFKGDPGH